MGRTVAPHRPGSLPRFVVAALAIALAAVGVAAPAGAVEIPVTSVEAWPNGRTVNDLPSSAVDGDSLTFTWTTNPNTIDNPIHLAIGFTSRRVNRLRLWKERDGGGGRNLKDLTIQYTTDPTNVPLSSRTWITVTGLTNGYFGNEQMVATSVSPSGTVTADSHNSTTGDGWASLTFASVEATGLRIAIVNPNPVVNYCDGSFGDQACNHYRVGEFEAHGPPDGVPGPGTWGLGAIAVLVATAGARILSRRLRSATSAS